MGDSSPLDIPVEPPSLLVCGATGVAPPPRPPLPVVQPVASASSAAAPSLPSVAMAVPEGDLIDLGASDDESEQETAQQQQQQISPSSAAAPAPSKSMEDVMREFVTLEQSLSMPDYIKRFYYIRVEQETLRNDAQYSCVAACNPIHFARNRYRDILPYDHNRVELLSRDDNPDGYMNASHVSLPGGITKFIAAQAPLPATLDEWWQMIDEQKISLVLMLCKLMEMCKVKCERYWPTEKGCKEIFGNYEITLEDEQTFEDDEYLLRVLKMENQTTGEARTVRQLHYREWPDHGCPSGDQQLLNMINRMAELHSGDVETPVLVHCSAGVGRTGTIIAVNHVRELIAANSLSSLDLYDLVMQLRRQRASMVQTQDQFQFVHKCVAHYCRRHLGLPEPTPPPIPPKPTVSPIRSYASAPPPPALDSSDDELEGTVVPDFPHEPPAPRGPEELGSAAS